MSRIRDLAKILTASTDMATDAEVTSSIASHAAAADPHTAYLKESEYWAAGKNKIINGDFNIWQRGTSFSPASSVGVYLADRFNCYVEGSGATRTISQQTFTTGSAPVSGYEGRFFLRYAQSVGPSAGIGNNLLRQFIEGVRTFAGQTVTFSFWAKASSSMTVELIDLIQDMGLGGSPSSNTQTVLATNVSIGTSWTRYTYTATLPSLSGKTLGTSGNDNLAIRLNMPTGSGATFTFDTWGWQLEAGSTATTFTTATGNPALELAACQRYYWRQVSGTNYGLVCTSGIMESTTGGSFVVQLPVPMRVAPTSIDTSNLRITDLHTTNSPASSFTLSDKNELFVVVRANASGLTANRPAWLTGYNSGTSYLGLSAELVI
jgi:hypothetical protein